MNTNDKMSMIESEVAKLLQDNLRLKNEIEELELNRERQIDEIINDFIKVIDAYDKAEGKVREMDINEDENVERVIKRLSQPLKVALSVLSKYNVNIIDIEGKTVDENLCTIVEAEPYATKEDGFVLTVEKKGYVRGERLIRRAEVVVVRN